ncbi:hypothetical protein LSM04_009754 [Trypanosoma melophagium]|uniref:uncharacterized protein n=1 Tax=Trypanosoma melophagium TaxID=715481 RepID=UPI00351A3572|nr:hypothetical protein LSM04_009754 [Trypanosoma melophagium]
MQADIGLPLSGTSSSQQPLSRPSSGPDFSSADVNIPEHGARHAVNSVPTKKLNESSVGQTKYAAPVLDAETRNLVARMRGIIYNQRSADEVKRNKQAEMPATATPPYDVDHIGKWSYLFRNPFAKEPRASTLSQKMAIPDGIPTRAAVNNIGAVGGSGCTDAMIYGLRASGPPMLQKWHIVLTAGVGDENEGENGFMTLECDPPSAATTENSGKKDTNSNTTQFDSTTIIKHLTRMISPLSYTIRAVFYYDCDFGSYMLLTSDTARYAGWRFRVFVVPQSSSRPLDRRSDTLLSAIAPSISSSESDAATETNRGTLGSGLPAIVSLPATTRCTTCALGNPQAKVNTQSRGKGISTPSLQQLSNNSVYSDSQLPIIDRLQIEIQEDMTRLKSIVESVEPALPRKKNYSFGNHGDSRNSCGRMEAIPAITTTGGATKTSSIAPRYSVRPR